MQGHWGRNQRRMQKSNRPATVHATSLRHARSFQMFRFAVIRGLRAY